jgi:hypothetical protein
MLVLVLVQALVQAHALVWCHRWWSQGAGTFPD